MKIQLTEKEFKYLDDVSPYTDLVPSVGEKKGNKIELEMSLKDWEELNGYIAAEANHTESRTAEKVLDGLFFKIERKLKETD